MSQTGKFIPGGPGKKPAFEPGRSEPIRAPAPIPEGGAPSSGKRLFAKGAAERLTKPVDPKRKPGITIISVFFCVFFISIGWYFLAVAPVKKRAKEIQLELDKRNKEFAEFQKKEEARIAAENARNALPALLKITSRPDGATVTIGDIVHPTPAVFKELKGGKYTMKIELLGYETVTREITIESGKTTDLGVVDLFHKVGRLKVTSTLPGVTYSLTGPDGYNHNGQLNLNLENLPEGDYTLIAEHKGWILPELKLQVKSGEETQQQINFPYASIELNSIPAGATVKFGKKTVGDTPFVLKELRPGPLNYALELPGYRLGRAHFDVTNAANLKQTVTLEKSDDIITSFGMTLVKLPDDFWGGKYEVKQSEYEKVTGVNPSVFRGANHPVDSVTWNQAKEFCRKATEMEKTAGRLPSGYIFDLPTEPQWEVMLADSNLDGAVTSRDADLHSTAEVGSSEPNQYGIYDMLGNVWEWCLDTFDPSGRTHVMRGGSWLSSKENFPNSTVRNGAGENYRDKFTGFRVVLVKSQPGN